MRAMQHPRHRRASSGPPCGACSAASPRHCTVSVSARTSGATLYLIVVRRTAERPACSLSADAMRTTTNSLSHARPAAHRALPGLTSSERPMSHLFDPQPANVVVAPDLARSRLAAACAMRPRNFVQCHFAPNCSDASPPTNNRIVAFSEARSCLSMGFCCAKENPTIRHHAFQHPAHSSNRTSRLTGRATHPTRPDCRARDCALASLAPTAPQRGVLRGQMAPHLRGNTP